MITELLIQGFGFDESASQAGLAGASLMGAVGWPHLDAFAAASARGAY